MMPVGAAKEYCKLNFSVEGIATGLLNLLALKDILILSGVCGTQREEKVQSLKILKFGSLKLWKFGMCVFETFKL